MLVFTHTWQRAQVINVRYVAFVYVASWFVLTGYVSLLECTLHCVPHRSNGVDFKFCGYIRWWPANGIWHLAFCEFAGFTVFGFSSYEYRNVLTHSITYLLTLALVTHWNFTANDIRRLTNIHIWFGTI